MSSDIRAVLSLEDFEYLHGLERSATATQQFAAKAGAAGSMAGNLGRGLTQAGFAAQDFFSVLNMGGPNALARALAGTMNNVQMLGAAFGPMGMAATAVAGALGSMLIPKLLEGQGEFTHLSEEIKAAGENLQSFIKHQQEMIDFRDKLGKVGSQKELDELAGGAAKGMEKKAAEMKALDAAMGREQDRLNGLKASKAAATRDSWLNMLPGSKVSEFFGGPKVSDVIGFGLNKLSGVDDAIKESENRIKALLGQRGEALKGFENLAEQKKEAGTVGQEPFTNFKFDTKEIIARDKKIREDEKRAKEISKRFENPFEKARRELGDIFAERLSGNIDQDLFEKGAKRIKGELGEKTAPGANAGIRGGTAAAYEAIRDSIRESQKDNPKDNEKIRLLEGILDSMKVQLKATEKIVDFVPQEIPIA